MKRMGLLAVVVLSILLGFNIASYAECEPNLDNVRIIGRSVTKDGKTEFNWPMSGIEFEFDGKNAYVYVHCGA